MHYWQGLDALKRVPPGSVLTVGNFDGVHLGHHRLLERCRALSGGDAPIVVMTFEPHPLVRLRPELAPPRLTPPLVKARLLEEQGADILIELPPRSKSVV